MIVVPDSDIILLKSPLKLDNYNQITFASVTAQYNYFNSLPKLEYDGCTYQRKDGVIRYNTDKEENIDAPRFEDLLQYNYCMYKNDSYKDKWFYAYVTDVKYINDGMSEVTIDTDVFQTWQFDIIYMNSFIEREHVSDDTIGAHTIPEGLETGEYVINLCGECETNLDSCYTIIGTTFLPDNTPGTWGAQQYGGVFSGLKYVAFRDMGSANKFIKAMDTLDKADALTTMFMIPTSFVPGISWITGDLGGQTGIEVGIIPNYTGAIIIRNDINLTIPATLNGYTPKNNKMYCYPWNVLSITNNNGGNAEYHYEDFVNNNPIFSIAGVVCPGGSMKLYPNNYKKYLETPSIRSGYNFGLIGGKYPQCSWQSDSYTNWLTEQSVNQAVQYTKASVQSVLSSDPTNLLDSVTNILAERYTHSLQPPQAHGTNSGDVNFAMSQAGFTYYKMSVKYEYAKMADDYLTAYGYKVNRLATPNIHKRSNWDFIKCIDVNLEGNIPEKDLDKIRALFNNGCTFWHTTQYYLDYSQNNTIL